MFCVGTHRRQMDEKLRISLPKSLKSFLRDGKYGYLTPGIDGGLELHNEQSLQTRAREIREQLSGFAQHSVFERLFFARTNAVELDGHGRLRLPSALVEPAGLGASVVLVGTGGHWEIWDGDRWDSYVNDDCHNELLRGLSRNLVGDAGPAARAPGLVAVSATAGIGPEANDELQIDMNKPR